MILLVVLSSSTLVIFNSAVLIVPVSVGRALLFVIPKLPIAGGLKYNDLFAFAIGFCIISTIIAASRDLFVYIASGRTHLLASVIYKWGITALKGSPLLFIWIVIIPLLIGLLVNFLLISPFLVTANGMLVIDLFCTWFLGLLLLKFWVKLVGLEAYSGKRGRVFGAEGIVGLTRCIDAYHLEASDCSLCPICACEGCLPKLWLP